MLDAVIFLPQDTSDGKLRAGLVMVLCIEIARVAEVSCNV